jgi:hypothetical protein
MPGRIGALHVNYRVSSPASIGAALTPGFDRAILSRAGEAIDERLSIAFGNDPSVIVIRELRTRTVMSADDWSLDSRAADRIGRTTVDAVADALAGPSSPETLVRFADQAEYIGSFIVDILIGKARDRWYYGSFAGYCRDDSAGTVAGILAGFPDEAARVFDWLARRGYLAAVLALLGGRRALQLAAGVRHTHAHDAEGFAPLAAAAFDLLETAGWTIAPETRRALLEQYLASGPLPPSWTDRQSLSASVLVLARYLLRALASRGEEALQRGGGAERRLRQLPAAYDWLDLDWLSTHLDELAGAGAPRPASADARTRILAPHHEAVLARLAALTREQRLRIDVSADADAISVALLAAAAGEGSSEAGPPDRVLVAAIERIAAALVAMRVKGTGAGVTRADTDRAAASAPDRGDVTTTSHAVARVRDAGPAAAALFHAIVQAAGLGDAAGESAPAAGLYLLTRAVLDVRLEALAARCGVPFIPLRAALAMRWLRLAPPFDTATALWTGGVEPDPAAFEQSGASLADLQQALLDLLIDQRALDERPASLDGLTPLDAIAWLVLRAWSRWLPGVSGSSEAFLVQNCLRRRGLMTVTETLVALQIEPAPLDVVLEMAGYFRPIDAVPWLAGRRVTFAVARLPGA